MARRALLHPSFLIAVALLATNDHVLKPGLSNWWTGKLSDVAGLYVVAVLLGILTLRPRLAVVAAGAGFAAIKLSPIAALLAAPVLGGRTLQDPTDLAALLVLVPAYWFLARLTPTESYPDLLRTTAAALSGVAALASITATSCGSSAGVGPVVRDGDLLVASIVNGEPSRATSRDGGLTWHEAQGASARSEADQATCQATHCFRVMDEDRVEVQEAGGDWQRLFPTADHPIITAEQGCRGDAHAFNSVAARPDGDGVVVAMGSEGVLLLTADGEWEQRPVLSVEPQPLYPAWWQRLSVAPVMLFAAGPALFVLAFRTGRRQRVAALITCLVAGAVTILAAGVFSFFAVEESLIGLTAGIASVLAIVVALLQLTRPTRYDPDEAKGDDVLLPYNGPPWGPDA